MTYENVDIEVLPVLTAIRRRPHMYFGVPHDDPALPGRVLWWAVRDALAEQPRGRSLEVQVVIVADQRFVVADNGPGLPVEPAAGRTAPAVAEMLTLLMYGQPPPRGWTLGAVTALCSAVTAQVWTGGLHYRQQADWSGPRGPVEEFGPTTRSGTRLDFTLDGGYFGEQASLPSDPGPLLAGLLAGDGLLSSDAAPAIGTRLEITDRRTGAVVRLEKT